jgi:DNA-binding transcriptional MerR regulator
MRERDLADMARAWGGAAAGQEERAGSQETSATSQETSATSEEAGAGPGGLLTIGQLARETGVPDSTIRFWERKGLLAPTLRQGGQRRYALSAIATVAMLRLCQETGFSLADIRRLRDERAVTPRSWRRLVQEKLADVERQITALDHARELLTHALRCRHDDILACPSFQEWFTAYQEAEKAAGAMTGPGKGGDAARSGGNRARYRSGRPARTAPCPVRSG